VGVRVYIALFEFIDEHSRRGSFDLDVWIRDTVFGEGQIYVSMNIRPRRLDGDFA
jgi:hypothetical protein